MSPARRKRLIKLKKSKRTESGRNFKKLFLLTGIIILVILFVFLTTHFWSSDSKLPVLYREDNGDIIIAVFDPENDLITSFTTPFNTQVKVSRQLGTWKVNSLWQLGQNESLGGSLLTETYVNYFGLPVYAWSDTDFGRIAEGDFFGGVKGAIFPYKTNLGVGDRLNIFFYSLRVKNFNRRTIDLSATNAFKKEVLIGGEEGYILVGRLPEAIFAAFSDPKFSRQNINVQITESPNTRAVGERVGEVLQVLGAKVASVGREELADTDCLVSGKNDEFVKRVSLIFTCKIQKKDTNFDIEVKLGEKFVERF